jgi:hypothetical protein
MSRLNDRQVRLFHRATLSPEAKEPLPSWHFIISNKRCFLTLFKTIDAYL